MARIATGTRESPSDAINAVRSSVVSLLVFGAATASAAVLGGIFTSTGVDTWYAGLDKPIFNPPSWTFSVVWTILYAFMAFAAWHVWRRGPERKDVQRSTALFSVQLALNALWPFLFFALESPPAGLLGIVVLLGAIVVWYVSATRISRLTRWMILPYIAWVSFATILNGSIWWLNR